MEWPAMHNRLNAGRHPLLMNAAGAGSRTGSVLITAALHSSRLHCLFLEALVMEDVVIS